MKKIIFLIITTTILLSGCTNNNNDECENCSDPCGSSSNPTGGGVYPKEKQQNLSLMFHGVLDFREIIKDDGSVRGNWENRTARINFTLYNKGIDPISSRITFKEGVQNWKMFFEDSYFDWLECDVWITDTEITSNLYRYSEWNDGDWFCANYHFRDVTCRVWEYGNKTLILEYTLNEQPPGTFWKGLPEQFGIYISEGKGSWEYCPFEVLT